MNQQLIKVIQWGVECLANGDSLRDAMTRQDIEDAITFLAVKLEVLGKVSELQGEMVGLELNVNALIQSRKDLEKKLQGHADEVARMQALYDHERSRCGNLLMAHNTWTSKTNWVQEELNAGGLDAGNLGMHRADVMYSLVTGLRTRIDEITAAYSSELNELAGRNYAFRTENAKLRAELAEARKCAETMQLAAFEYQAALGLIKAQEPVDGVLLDDCEECSHPEFGRGCFFTDDCVRPLYAAPVAKQVVMPERKPQRITDDYARGWNDYAAEYARLNAADQEGDQDE